MIWTIGLAINGNKFWKKCVYVICEIFMQKSFVYFQKKYLQGLQGDSFFIFVLSPFLKIGLTVAVLACSEYLFKDIFQIFV